MFLGFVVLYSNSREKGGSRVNVIALPALGELELGRTCWILTRLGLLLSFSLFFLETFWELDFSHFCKGNFITKVCT